MRDDNMLALLLLSIIAVSSAAPTLKCDINALDTNGVNFTINAETGNVEYSCPDGQYPYPGPIRDCLRNGQWKEERQKTVCKVVECPRIVSFENGEYYPRQKNYFVGDVVYFECHGGFQMRNGAENRTCQANGKWSGKTTICDDQEGYCPNPGIPIGASKSGNAYRIEGKVQYDCQYGLKMFGSKQRICQEDRTWSGTEPICRFWYTYDTPEEVAEFFGASLAETIESSDPNRVEEKGDRKINIKKGGPMNIFIIIDASKSVGEKNFNLAKDITETFILRVSSFDFEPRYSVLTYASAVKTIVTLSEKENTDPEYVVKKIKGFKYKAHEDKQGTNTRAALSEVLNQLSLDLQNNRDTFFSRSNVILLMTDGKHNMGGDPAKDINRIKYMLNVNELGEDKLDIYAFGLGNDISQDELNDIASKKGNENHVFLMKSIDDMKEAFNSILNEAEAFEMCGLSKDYSKDIREKYPWIAQITITRPDDEESCKGSIISRNFILTAAHCFHLEDRVHYVTVSFPSEQKTITRKIKDIHRHPNYNPEGKQDKHIKKSFDFDFALLELEKKLDFDSTIRPICLPCTAGATWALKQRGKAVTCIDHRNLLLNGELVNSMFLTEEDQKNNFVQMNVKIKQGSKRIGCLDDTKKVPDFDKVADITDVVTDNFLCTGGIEPDVDPQTCKGDSGGPLIIQYKQRFVQVGVISWGTVISCQGLIRDQVPAESRDFHADVFKANDWISEVVKEDLVYMQ